MKCTMKDVKYALENCGLSSDESLLLNPVFTDELMSDYLLIDQIEKNIRNIYEDIMPYYKRLIFYDSSKKCKRDLISKIDYYEIKRAIKMDKVDNLVFVSKQNRLRILKKLVISND